MPRKRGQQVNRVNLTNKKNKLRRELDPERAERARCDKSPTNAHHWILPRAGALIQGTCKYCDAEREFDLNDASPTYWDSRKGDSSA